MKFFEHLEGYIAGQVKMGKTFFTLMKLETRLAGLSVFPLIITICMLLIILMTVWVLAMVLAQYGIVMLTGSPLIAISSALLFNLVLFAILLKYLSYNLKNMSFAKTRECLSKNKRIKNELEKAGDGKNYSDQKDLIKSTDQS